jgi:alkanesulfonate monooxygenase SsuD/methylene tetrahydromethanopterin reductase-like flavin-dependent oxidoreductase (luciferase family)
VQLGLQIPDFTTPEGPVRLGADLAACTSRAKLLSLVTGVYRYPGILAKIITTLDVLSGGRAWLGIGAAWNEEESRGLGIPFPPVAERFERLEETLQICLVTPLEVIASDIIPAVAGLLGGLTSRGARSG